MLLKVAPIYLHMDIPHVLIPCNDNTNKGVSNDVDDGKNCKYRHYRNLSWFRNNDLRSINSLKI